MKPTKTEQLRELLAEASPGPWYLDVDGEISRRIPSDPEMEECVLNNYEENAKLICFLRNNAALLLEIVEAAEKLANNTDYRWGNLPAPDADLDQALCKWNGGE